MLLTLLGNQSAAPVDPPVVDSADCWGGAWGLSWGDSWGVAAVVPVLPASLGGWTDDRKRKKRRLDDELDEIQEALPADVVSRIRNEMLSASLAQDVIARAKSRAKRMRSEEEALLLML